MKFSTKRTPTSRQQKNTERVKLCEFQRQVEIKHETRFYKIFHLAGVLIPGRISDV